jgi:hypothetical protein
VAADAPARDREAELLAVRATALAGVDVEAGAAQPPDRDVLQRVADGEDAQEAAAEPGALVLRRVGELEL